MHEYRIVQMEAQNLSFAIEEVEKEVSYFMQMGWKPQGGVSISIKNLPTTAIYIVCQSIIRQ